MTHNLSIAVNVDDEAIKEAVLMDAGKQINHALFHDGINNRTFYGNNWSRQFSNAVDKAIEKAISNDLREEIIGKVSEAIAEKLVKSNVFRDKVVKAVTNEVNV